MNHEETPSSLTHIKPRYGTIQDDERLSAEEMDERRRQNIAYEYLCHLEEAKRWMEACLEEELPPTTELEEGLRNGVYLGKLATFFAPKMVSEKRLYDRTQNRYKSTGLHFRHTDNTVQWLRGMESVGLPKIFYPETTDVYDRKNMPKVVYCIHALSLYLYKLGIAPQIQDLLGKVDFTEEEISNMRSELEKYGIQMPTFSKIGGILANELSVDEAALHAAVIAINEAIDRGVASVTMGALQNPNAMLRSTQEPLAQRYQEALSRAKSRKEDTSSGRRSSVATEDREIYEELLTQMEIQDCIHLVNMQAAVEQVQQAVHAQDEASLLGSLRLDALGLLGVQDPHAAWYLEQLTACCQGDKAVVLDREEIQRVVSCCNDAAETERRKLLAVEDINTAVRLGDAVETAAVLSNPDAQLPIIYHTAARLYQDELFSLQLQSKSGLSHEELSVAVEMLSAVAVLNEVLDTKDPAVVSEQLSDSPLGLTNMEHHNLNRYADTLITLRSEAVAQGQEFLTWNDLQKCIDNINVQVHEEHERIMAIAEINEAVSSGDYQQTLAALLLPSAQLTGLRTPTAWHYHDVLLHAKTLLCERSGDQSAVLWLDHIQEAIHTANQDEEEALILCAALADINRAVSEGNSQNTLQALQNPNAALRGVLAECGTAYQTELTQSQLTNTTEGSSDSEWVRLALKDSSYEYFYNLQRSEGSWVEPEGFQHNSTQLSREQIQSVVSAVGSEFNRKQLWLANEPLVTLLQARVRGHLVRKRHAHRMEFLRQQEPHVVKIQACWKGCKQRKKYKDRMNVLQSNVGSVVKLQSMVKMWRAKRTFTQRKQFFKDHEKDIVKIQAFLKANKARENYRTLTGAQDPPLSVVRKFVHLLEQSPLDLTEEQEVTRLREEVVTKIRSNQQMEKDLNLMDIKIGLLVKNRITLQDVVLHSKKMKKVKEEMESGGGGVGVGGASRLGLKGLSKGRRRKLEAYQHLFYLLQTNPSYLAKLIFQMPQNKSTKFMDTVIFTLYNYASNQREEYLLLKLFKTALEEEIKSKVDQLQDIVTGNPTVIKMVVSFNRGARGHNALRALLGGVVRELLTDRSLGINTNPVDVYKSWVNQMESSTGEASNLPYEVTPEQAMSHEEVRSRLEASSLALRSATDKVLNSITSSLDNIPYGMRYIAKVLKNCLHEKFPDATEDELLKIVGNLLYYRYMNPAIVAPDGFDIIDVSAGGQLTSEQRRNLGSVAKVLQHAAANKVFQEAETAHMTPMNQYITATYHKFRQFFQACCDVPEPEERFNVDEYSDMVTLSKPVIYISVEEIINTHSLVLCHLDAISPDHNDLLHELLNDLGDTPTVEALLGEGSLDPNDPGRASALSQLAKTEISLTLTCKMSLLEGEEEDMKGLMIKTKKLIVDVVRTQPGETLLETLETPATAVQECEHAQMVERRAAQEAQTPEGLKVSAAVQEDAALPLEQKKRKILRNLRTLEGAGLVSASRAYQEVINDIAKDIRYQRRYRQRRKAELVKLQQALSALNSKTTFYQEQLEYYDTYIKTCLDNLTRRNCRRSIKADSKVEQRTSRKGKQAGLKYTAARLHEKGVILEIEGLQSNQFKNVMFDICPSEEVGDFEVKAKFMGVEMEKVQLHFQDLLQLQYDGVAVMKMFDKAKINVNLLVFLLNKKFYGK